jgi:cytochrome c2
MCHEAHFQDKGTCLSCHRGNDETSRKNIAHKGLITKDYADFYISRNSDKGKQIVDNLGCRRCHKISGKGVDAAVSLDSSAANNTGEYLFDKIKNVNEYMPDFKLKDEEIKSVAKYLILKSGDRKDSSSEPFVTYIKSSEKGVFEKECGDCHKLLTRKGGGKGTGYIAANLSGLFSEYFRSNVLKTNDKKWDKELLLKWIDNPRSIKKLAIMPPIKLSEEDKKKLIKELSK